MAWKPPAEDRITPAAWTPPAADRADAVAPVAVVPLADTNLGPRNLAGPRRIYSAFQPGAKSRYDTDEARAGAYVQSLVAQGRLPSLVEALFPRASSVSRSKGGFGRFAFATGKDFTSGPGRILTSRAQEVINKVRGTHDAGATTLFGMADPTGRAIGQTNVVTDIARDPWLLPSLYLGSKGGWSMPARVGSQLGFGLARPMLERAADYDAATTWAPTTRELVENGAMALLPEAIGGIGVKLATPARTTAKRMFMSNVKAPPHLRGGQVWESVNEFSDDPALMREIIGKRTSYPELAEGWDVGNAWREAEVTPVMQRMKDQGVRIPISAATKEARNWLADIPSGRATQDQLFTARNEVDRLAELPESQYLNFALHDGVGPIPLRESWDPFEARTFKKEARERVKDFTDPMSDVRSAAFGGAGKGIQTALERADETGTLAAKNAQWGRWLNAHEAFERMRNRTTNNNPAKWWQLVKKYRENPQLVVRMLDAEQAAQNSGTAALQLSPFTRSLIQDHLGDEDYE